MKFPHHLALYVGFLVLFFLKRHCWICQTAIKYNNSLVSIQSIPWRTVFIICSIYTTLLFMIMGSKTGIYKLTKWNKTHASRQTAVSKVSLMSVHLFYCWHIWKRKIQWNIWNPQASYTIKDGEKKLDNAKKATKDPTKPSVEALECIPKFSIIHLGSIKFQLLFPCVCYALLSRLKQIGPMPWMTVASTLAALLWGNSDLPILTDKFFDGLSLFVLVPNSKDFLSFLGLIQQTTTTKSHYSKIYLISVCHKLTQAVLVY